MNLSFSCKNVTISPNTGREMSIDIEVQYASDILREIDISDIVDHYDKDDLLEKIGVDAAKKYFDLIDNDA